MEPLLSDTTKAILMSAAAVVFGLNWLARRRPEIAWLKVFRLPEPQLTEAQKERRRRTSNRIAGLEMMTAGLAMPLLYLAATVMMFNDFKPLPTLLVAAASVSCIAAGVWIFWRSR